MDWSEYKRLCDRPCTFSRWMIEQSIELVADEPRLSSLLARALQDPELEKPQGHRGGTATDMFTLRLQPDEAVALYRHVQAAACDGRRTAATRERGLGGFVAAWREYVVFLDQRRGSPNSELE